MESFVQLVELVQGVSVILAALVAVYSFDAWRREFIGKRRMEPAEEVLALFYEARGVLRDIRNPASHVGEGAARQPVPNETPDQKYALDRAYVVLERTAANRETFNRILALRYRFMAQFGAEAGIPFDRIIAIVDQVAGAAHGKMLRALTAFDATESSERIGDRIDNLLWQSLDDPLQPRVDAIVTEMERVCGGIINSRGTLFGALNKKWFGDRR